MVNIVNILSASLFLFRYKLKLGALKRTDGPSQYQLVDSEKAIVHKKYYQPCSNCIPEKNDIGLIRMKQSFDSMYFKSRLKKIDLKCICSKKCFCDNFFSFTLSLP